MTEHRIYLSGDTGLYAVVDAIDFEWAQQWRWHPTENSTGLKFYATRMTRERGTRKQIKVYMHIEILKRSGKKSISRDHTIGDHDDGQSLNDRRGNLFWATLRQNNTDHRYSHVLRWVDRQYGHDAEHL